MVGLRFANPTYRGLAGLGLDHRSGQMCDRMHSRAILARVIRGWTPRLRGIP